MLPTARSASIRPGSLKQIQGMDPLGALSMT
jgi:hypothetical protein